MAVTYEWAIETIADGAVVDVDHARTYAQAMRGYIDGQHVALVRVDEWDGDRDYYYVPFTDHAQRSVPKRYREQVARAGVLPSDRPATDCEW